MELSAIIANLTSPPLLFFVLGMIATGLRSDLEIPEPISKFLSLYLLMAIGFKGGIALANSPFTPQIGYAIGYGILLATTIPLVIFFILRHRFDVENAGAIAATYGSVSAVTFVTAISFLETKGISYNGYMVAVMALMESPAIIVGMALIAKFAHNQSRPSLKYAISHAFTNGSVLLILGSLIIGMIADSHQSEGIKPFTTDIFKGFLSLFLLDVGMSTAKKLQSFAKQGGFLVAFAIVAPLFFGLFTAWTSHSLTNEVSDRFLLAVLAASASYIAVPAAMRLAAPNANSGYYIPMALGVTFPFNIVIGLPLYFAVAS